MNLLETKIFFTDGSCRKNPGPGGYGIVHLVTREEGTELVLSITNQTNEETTNNREEIKAILNVFEIAANDPDNQYIIYSDSAYCVNMINDWIWNWAKNNWKNSKKVTVENYDLVKQLYYYLNKDFFNCQVKKCSGHIGIVENELADALATYNLSKFKKIIKDNGIIIKNENLDNLEKLCYN